MSKSKKLPLGAPVVRGYLHHAYPLSILSLHEDYIPWLHCNYIQLIGDRNVLKTGRGFLIEFYHPTYDPYPCLQISHLDLMPELIPADRCIEEIVRMIDNDIYFHTFIDEFYVSGKFAFEKSHFTHRTMIHGYDLQKECLYTTGYDRSMNYCEQRIVISEFETAYKKADFRNSTLYKYHPQFKPKFNIDTVILELDGYLQSTTCSIGNWEISDNSVYGMDCYKLLIDYLLLFINKPEWINIIPFHMFWEHKKCMLERMEYLYKLNYPIRNEIILQYKEIEGGILLVRNKILKYLVTYNILILQQAVEVLDNISKKEFIVLSGLNRILKESREKYADSN